VRVAFFGTSAFGAGALRRLVEEDGIDVVAVISQPDRPAGRGRTPRSASLCSIRSIPAAPPGAA